MWGFALLILSQISHEKWSPNYFISIGHLKMGGVGWWWWCGRGSSESPLDPPVDVFPSQQS